MDDTWQERGFNSRSEFIRYTLRDAVEFPTFDRDELVALLEAEEEIREGRRVQRKPASGSARATSDEGWTWELSSTAEDDLDRLSPAEQDRILDKLDETVSSPWRNPPDYGEQLQNSP